MALKIGGMLREQGLITEEQLQKALEEATKQGDTEEIEEVTVALKENAHLWLSSAYYRAYCLATTNRAEEAIAVYKIVTAETEDNEYLETSLREVVRLTMETADKTGAIAALEELSAKSSDEKLKTEAMIRAAMLYGDGDEVDVTGRLAHCINPPGRHR